MNTECGVLSTFFTFLPVTVFISVCYQGEDGKKILLPLSLKGSGIMPSLHFLL